MRLIHFFRIALFFQILAGIALFIISLFIEYRILQAFMMSTAIALSLAVTLECSKAVAIIWHRYFSMQPGLYPNATRRTSFSFRIGLTLLSLVCSLLFMARHIDRPNVEQVRSTDLKHSEQSLGDALRQLDKTYRQQVETFTRQQQAARSELIATHTKNIAKLQKRLEAEMQHVVQGQFRGPRYREIERLLDKAEQRMDRELALLDERQQKARMELDQNHQQRAQALRKKAAQRNEGILEEDYADDNRAHDPYIIAMLSIAKTTLPFDITPLQFIFVFSLLVSILMELGILLAFDSVTVTLMPALQNQHQEDLETEILKSQLAADSRRQDLKHHNWIQRIIKGLDRTEEGAARAASASAPANDDKLAGADNPGSAH